MKNKIQSYKKNGLSTIKLSKRNEMLIKDFLSYCKITACDSSIVKIKGKIRLIADTFEKDLDKITMKNLEAFLVLLNNSELAIATKNDIKKTLKRFIKRNYKDWSSKFNGLMDVKLNTKQEKRDLSKSDLLTPDEMSMIISSAESLKYKTILLLMQETACRPEELMKLKWGAIDNNSREIKLHSAKTKEDRFIPINESYRHLERYKKECFYDTPRDIDYIFPSPRDNQKHITTQALNDFILKLERKLKFKKHLYPYLWRHSILSQMITKLSPKLYEMYSGHSLETGMKIYAHLDTEDLKKELWDKVYGIEELTPEERDIVRELKKEFLEFKKIHERDIKILREQLPKEILNKVLNR